jgi:hypothetical protein
MLYPFELRAPGSGNRNFNKGSSQSVVWGTTREVPAQPQYRTASARLRLDSAPLGRIQLRCFGAVNVNHTTTPPLTYGSHTASRFNRAAHFRKTADPYL